LNLNVRLKRWLQSFNALNTNSSHLHAKFLQPLINLHTCITTSRSTRCSRLAIARPPRSPCLRITNRSFQHHDAFHFLSVINSLVLSVGLIPALHFLTHLFLFVTSPFCLFTIFITKLFYTNSSTCFTNNSHHRQGVAARAYQYIPLSPPKNQSI